VCHLHRTIYCVLKERKVISSKNRGIYIFMCINMILLWLSWFVVCALDPYELIIPNGWRYFGMLVFITGFILFLIPFFQLGGVENINRLHTDGIYKILRHPMYLGFIFWNLGLPLFLQSKISMFVSIIWIANILIWRYLEENELISKYDGYLEFKRDTVF